MPTKWKRKITKHWYHCYYKSEKSSV